MSRAGTQTSSMNSKLPLPLPLPWPLPAFAMEITFFISYFCCCCFWLSVTLTLLSADLIKKLSVAPSDVAVAAEGFDLCAATYRPNNKYFCKICPWQLPSIYKDTYLYYIYHIFIPLQNCPTNVLNCIRNTLDMSPAMCYAPTAARRHLVHVRS